MNRTAVTSTDIESVGYNSETQMLEVEFKRNNRVYQYEGVSPEIYAALLRSTSIGAFFHTAIKNGGYSYKEIKDR